MAPEQEFAVKRVWQIPELIRLILEHLSRKDLLALLRVCRIAWQETIPLLYDTIPPGQTFTLFFTYFTNIRDDERDHLEVDFDVRESL